MPEPADQAEPRDVRAQREVALAREETAWELRIEKGWSYKRIGNHLGITRQGAAKICRRVERRTLARLESQVALVKARQTAQLEHLLGELMAAWQRSKKPARKLKIADGPDGTTKTREKIGRDGSPAFVGQMLDVMAAIRSIWGIGPQTETGDPTATLASAMEAIRAERLAGLSEDERRRRLAFSMRAVAQRQRELADERDRLAAEIGGEDMP